VEQAEAERKAWREGQGGLEVAALWRHWVAREIEQQGAQLIQDIQTRALGEQSRIPQQRIEGKP
jgi:hypothetical protein